LAFVGDKARSANAFKAAVDALGYQDDLSDYYQTPRRDLAGVLALAAEAKLQPVVESLAQRVGDQLPEPEKLSTQEKAYLLMAAHALLAGGAGAEITQTGVETAPANVASYTLSPADLRRGVRFDNRGGAPVWRTVVARGAPTSAPPEAAERVNAVKR